MRIFLDEAAGSGSSDGRLRLYIDGDLQFDTEDEALYHESLALPPLCLHAAVAAPRRVLICGGGDGLALRECLRFPGVDRIDLVDYSQEMIDLGKGRLAGINARSFFDPRVHIHVADAWDYLAARRRFDVILCDFTVPRRYEDTRVFSREWYLKLGQALTAEGILGINAVSPETTPEAFWCLNNTLTAAGLKPLPYRVCIPSFREHGLGAWAFILASRSRITSADLKSVSCPVATRQADIARLWRGAAFSRADRNAGREIPVNTLENGCLLPLLLNPGFDAASDPPVDASAMQSPYDIEPLLSSIPISHPYHTRTMVETVARQVAGYVRDLDIFRLLDALIQRAARLPAKLAAELRRLKEYLQERSIRFELFSEWSYRLFAALIVLMTLANTIAPDNAFAKGSFGGGAHGGFSVGHSSFGGEAGGSFGGVRGSSFSGRGTSGSFGGSRGFSLSSSRSSSSFGSVLSTPGSPTFTGSGFRTSFGYGHSVDMYGITQPARFYIYCGSGYGHYHSYTQVYGGTRPTAPPETHPALFLASEDMSVLDNGDVVVNVSQKAYLLVTGGTVALMSSSSPDPLLMLYPDPGLFANILDQIGRQQAGVQSAIQSRRNWLSWVGWTSPMLSAVAGDRTEMNNLTNLATKLDAAEGRLGQPPKDAVPVSVAADQIELFIGAVLMPDGTVSLRGADGQWVNTDGLTLKATGAKTSTPCPKALADALRQIITKNRSDVEGGIKADQYDLQQLYSDNSSYQRDLTDYEQLFAVNGYDPNYQVDYGTDEIAVSTALDRTRRDLAQNEHDIAATQADIDKLQVQSIKIDQALSRFPI